MASFFVSLIIILWFSDMYVFLSDVMCNATLCSAFHQEIYKVKDNDLFAFTMFGY